MASYGPQDFAMGDPPKTPGEFKKRLFSLIIDSNLPYTAFTAPQFKTLLFLFQGKDEFLDTLFPNGSWITRDWLIETYPDVRSELDPKFLARGDQMVRTWTLEKQREERTNV
ncbi:hypothetical protein F4818DRAFT_235573 [Hypoxylon cercidicola]|nr:hypothetical protein F4818DRAFT_235573 [Hypoxylon cercidicola]